MARPSKLTPAVRETLLECLREGMSREATADLCGVSRTTLHEWMTRAGDDFADALKVAEASAERVLLKAVRAGGAGWQGSAWILERRWRDRWGRGERIEHRGSVVAATVPLTAEDRARLLRVAADEAERATSE